MDILNSAFQYIRTQIQNGGIAAIAGMLIVGWMCLSFVVYIVSEIVSAIRTKGSDGWLGAGVLAGIALLALVIRLGNGPLRMEERFGKLAWLVCMVPFAALAILFGIVREKRFVQRHRLAWFVCSALFVANLGCAIFLVVATIALVVGNAGIIAF